MDTQTRATRIRLAVFDIDGVMTDGGLHYTDDGHELKTFHVQDGLGIKLLQRAGIELAIVTGRLGGVVARRAADLEIHHVAEGVKHKGEAVAQLLEKLDLDWSAVAFMGDDLIDLPALRRCGLAIAPANARPVVKQHAHLVTEAFGGHGAVREAAEFILTAQGLMDGFVAGYLEM